MPHLRGATDLFGVCTGNMGQMSLTLLKGIYRIISESKGVGWWWELVLFLGGHLM